MPTGQEILLALRHRASATRAEIASMLPEPPSESTMKRLLAAAVKEGTLCVEGRGPSTRYALSPQALLTMPIDVEAYFQKEMDQRRVRETFNFDLIRGLLPQVELFTAEERARLEAAQRVFAGHVAEMSPCAYRKEMERLGVDLSWKSSQIEGNTYSLLETERLLKEKLTASGKTKEEAIMLLNHKAALDFVLENPDYLSELTIHRIEDIHSLLVQELDVERNLRHRRVGITGTNYRPLDNEFQIREALEDTCTLINARESPFDRALLALLLISYIQPFMDGNKRTARITANAILIAAGHCPISFRTVSSIDYKKAMLLFYEQNSLHAFKRIFIEQFEFATRTYF